MPVVRHLLRNNWTKEFERMNTKTLALCGLAAVLGLGVTFGVSAQTGTTPDPTAAVQAGKMGREKHPELKAALKALRNAKTRLQQAARDFGGHRTKAVEHTDEAIAEVEAAIAFDKK
jgi:hypothetical protein